MDNQFFTRGIIKFLLFFLIFFYISRVFPVSASEREKLQENARKMSRSASTVLAPVYGPLAEYIVSEYNLFEKKGIGIDVGGGPGNLIIELCNRTQNLHWINIDINPAFLPYSAKMAEKAGVGDRVSSLYSDVQDLPFKDGYADIIVSRGSFHLWNDKQIAFTEIYRVLKPDGIAFIGRGFSDNLPVETARQIRAQQKKGGGEPIYDKTQTAKDLETIMKSLGIKNYRIIIPDPPGREGINYGIWIEFHKPGP